MTISCPGLSCMSCAPTAAPACSGLRQQMGCMCTTGGTLTAVVEHFPLMLGQSASIVLTFQNDPCPANAAAVNGIEVRVICHGVKRSITRDLCKTMGMHA